jgi:hypothetical protein
LANKTVWCVGLSFYLLRDKNDRFTRQKRKFVDWARHSHIVPMGRRRASADEGESQAERRAKIVDRMPRYETNYSVAVARQHVQQLRAATTTTTTTTVQALQSANSGSAQANGGEARVLGCYAPGSELPASVVASMQAASQSQWPSFATYNDLKWGASSVLGTSGGVVTFSFADADGYACDDEYYGCRTVPLDAFMPNGWKYDILAAFAAWQTVANIRFVEVNDNDLPYNANGAVADIRIAGHHFDGPFGVLAHAFYPPP